MTNAAWEGVGIRLDAGLVHSNEGSHFRMRLHDESSGAFIVELQLSGDQFLQMMRGSYMDVKGDLAKPRLAERWTKVAVRERIEVPSELTQSIHREDDIKRVVCDWYEDQPGSGQVDEYYPGKSESHWYVHTITYVDAEEHAEANRLKEQSEEVDELDEGEWDDEDTIE